MTTHYSSTTLFIPRITELPSFRTREIPNMRQRAIPSGVQMRCVPCPASKCQASGLLSFWDPYRTPPDPPSIPYVLEHTQTRCRQVVFSSSFGACFVQLLTRLHDAVESTWLLSRAARRAIARAGTLHEKEEVSQDICAPAGRCVLPLTRVCVTFVTSCSSTGSAPPFVTARRPGLAQYSDVTHRYV